MKHLVIILIALTSIFSYAQEKDEEKLLAIKKANNYVYEGNEQVSQDKYIAAEMEYRKAISEQPANVAGAYNLGNSYYKKNKYDEALYRYEQAAKNSTSKSEKHKAYHNIGNILMKNKKCKEAVEAFKNALRNDPTDDETRYNLGLAKECAEKQKDDDKGNDKDKDKDKKDEDKKDQDKQDNKDKKEGDDKKDEEGKPKDDKQDKGKGDEKKDEKKQQPQPGQLSPQQIKNLLEAMNNQEQKVQEKINAEKQKGVKVKTEKDW
ncbi:tetratricopeptide repeat protein [Aquaticitalea lipolytica]|uniref:tetratricopeptide repeat protein n=1 Tax=Aquaticitalea lipolytica TaxID=1247562 RepID=UPI0024BBA4AF|nr:tetratricopeptide repeat protein [Aquaticitalea lipolytica]